MTALTDLQEYWQQLREHDWYYQMSDDPGVNSRGVAAERRLQALCSRGDDWKAIWDEWFAFKWLSSGVEPVKPGEQ